MSSVSSSAPNLPPYALPTNPKDGAELVYIPAGKFLIGDDDRIDNPPHTVELSAYYIYKNLVTVEQYAAYCTATGKSMPPAPDFNEGWSKRNHPIVNVNWHEAREYAVWAGGDLPSEAQWERAARGAEGLKYPWGDKWDASKLWCRKMRWKNARGTASVGNYAVSPDGCTDMAGNVWQWCLDEYDATFWESEASRTPNPVNDAAESRRALRGGSWDTNNSGSFRCSTRHKVAPGFRDFFIIGFRVVLRGN